MVVHILFIIECYIRKNFLQILPLLLIFSFSLICSTLLDVWYIFHSLSSLDIAVSKNFLWVWSQEVEVLTKALMQGCFNFLLSSMKSTQRQTFEFRGTVIVNMSSAHISKFLWDQVPPSWSPVEVSEIGYVSKNKLTAIRTTRGVGLFASVSDELEPAFFKIGREEDKRFWLLGLVSY